MSLSVTDSIFKTFFEASADAMFLLSAQGVILTVNPAASTMFLRVTEDLCNSNVSSLFSSKESSPLNESIIDKSQPASGKWVGSCIRGDGSHFMAEVRTTPHRDNDGQLSFIAVISERIKLEELLQEQTSPEDLLTRTVALEKVGGWQVDLKTMKHTWTLETFHIAEIEPPNEPPVAEGINLFAPEARPVIAAAVQAAIDSSTPYNLELPFITAKGRRIWVRTQGFGEMIDGKVVRIYGTFKDITEQHNTVLALRESEERWRFAIEGSGDAVWDWDLVSGVLQFSDRWLEILGYNASEIGFSLDEWLRFAHPEDSERVMTKAIAHIDGKADNFTDEYRMKCKDGSWKWILGRGLVVKRDANGAALRMIGTNTDINLRKQTDLELRIAAAAFSAQEGIIITDDQKRILRVNSTFEKTLGYTQDEVLGENPSLFSSDRHDDNFYKQMWEEIDRVGVWHGEIWDRRKNGEIFPQSVTISSVRNSEGKITNYVGTFIDISEIKQAKAAISRLSYYDSLTGLINRDQLKLSLESAIKKHSEQKTFGGLLMVSLDNFKTINSTFGQDAGDRILIEVSSRLQKSVHPSDIVSRFGGDEFVLILTNLGNTQEQASQSLLIVAQTILSRLEDNYAIDKSNHFSTSSIGATIFGASNDNATSLELFNQLNTALFNAKQDGRNRVSFFNPDWQAAVNERVQLLNELRKGIEQHEFVMFYQPQTDKVGNIVSAEALVRWNHPTRGLLNPSEFIALAENNGLIVNLGEEIMHMCLAQLQRWQNQQSTQHLKLSINITADQFYVDGFADKLEALITQSHLDVSGIMLEFTETTLLNDIELARANINRLNALGVSFAIDDFGTGYSSLTYLSQLSMDQLKIDKSFVQNIGKNEKDASIIRTIIDMARSLGMNVLAEGVETAAQRKYLLQHGCQYFQGYLFSRPVPIEEFNALVTKGRLTS